jgi:uroporphyrinogen-III synthase
MSSPPKKIWITRAQPGAEATAARVRELGHTPFVAPLLAVQALPPAPIELAGVAALAFTSGNGVRAFCDVSADRSLQVFAVGAATAAAARAAGFRRVLSADGDVRALAERLAARKSEFKGAILHAGAAEPAGDLAGALTAAGIEARHIALYDTAPTALSATELADLPGVDVALVHSPKGAEALAELLKAHPQPRLRVLAISKAALRPLARTAVADRASAPFPLEAAMLNLIGR